MKKTKRYTAIRAISKQKQWTADDIKKLREAHGLTQEDLADLLGTKQTSICRLESGRHVSRYGTNTKLSAVEQELERRAST